MKKLGIVGSTNALYTDSFVPITEIVLVEIPDIDDMAYFAGTVGQKKEVIYYDIDYSIMYKDVFEYSSTSPTSIINIKRTNKDFYKGLYDASSTIYPVTGSNGDFYYIYTAGTIDLVTYIAKDVLIMVNNVWKKGVYSKADNKFY